MGRLPHDKQVKGVFTPGGEGKPIAAIASWVENKPAKKGLRVKKGWQIKDGSGVVLVVAFYPRLKDCTRFAPAA
jgi:hypothetical protein